MFTSFGEIWATWTLLTKILAISGKVNNDFIASHLYSIKSIKFESLCCLLWSSVHCVEREVLMTNANSLFVWHCVQVCHPFHIFKVLNKTVLGWQSILSWRDWAEEGTITFAQFGCCAKVCVCIRSRDINCAPRFTYDQRVHDKLQISTCTKFE